MSHEILEEDRLVFTGATPWHGIGINLPPLADFNTWVDHTRLNWDIRMAPVEYADQGDGLRLKFPDRYVMYRSDSRTALSIASGRFKPVQPREILAFFRDLVERQGFKLETVGTLKNGKYIWGLARVGKLGYADKYGDDPVRAYLLLCTICQPGFATTARFTGVRVVCNNTMQMALADGSQDAVRVSHIEDFDPVEVKHALGLGVPSFELFMHDVKKLAARKLTNEEALDYFTSLVGDPELEPEDPKQPQTLTTLQKLYITPSYPALEGSTLWAALNTVTNYVDYRRPDRGAGGRLTSAWFGTGRKMKGRAWNIAVNYERTGSFAATGSGTKEVVRA